MTQELRQRRTNPDNSETMDFSSGLTRSSLLRASPQEHGKVQKLRIPLLYTILPTWLRSVVSKMWILSSWLSPRWDERYLVLVGSFLYKFSGENPKGSPVPVDSVDVFLVEEDGRRSRDYDGTILDDSFLPQGFRGVLCVSTFRKKYYYAVPDKEQALLWVNSLREAREEAIKRSMGHAHQDSYPRAWSHFDTLGASLRNQKDRVRNRMQEKSLQELQMSQLSEGGPMPRGYYG